MTERSAIRKILLYLLGTALGIFLFAAGCKKPTEVGLEVLPASDLLNTPFTDTSTIQCYTLREDSLRSDELSKVLLGSMYDADFGLSQASIYAQVLLGNTPTLKTNGADTIMPDSLVLALAYNGYCGNTATSQTVHVFQLSDDIYVDSTYYTDRNFQSQTTDFANNFSFVPRPADSVSVNSVNEPAQLRIPLSLALADSLISFLTNTSNYQTNDTWKTVFKGIYIKTDSISSGGSVLYFDPLNAYSKMTLYYHEYSSVDTVAKSYDFLINGARINHETHSYGNTPAGISLANSSFTNTDSVSYLQSMAGLKVKVRFPYIKNLAGTGHVSINKAQLILTVPSGTIDSLTSPPTSILLSAYDSTGAIKFLPDYFEGNPGGTYDATNHTYTFALTRQLQQIIDGKVTDYDFSLNILSSGVQANRVIIGTHNSSGTKMKLRLYYTKLR